MKLPEQRGVDDVLLHKSPGAHYDLGIGRTQCRKAAHANTSQTNVEDVFLAMLVAEVRGNIRLGELGARDR